MSYSSWTGNANKTTVSSGLVTFNCGTGDDIVKWRLSRAKAGADLFGQNASHNGDPLAFMHIREWQPLLVHRNPADARRNILYSRGSALKLMTFGSFNMSERMSKEEAEDTHELAGFAGGSHTFGELSQPDTGVASVVAGSFSTRNTGISTWSPGSLLQWEGYPMGKGEEDKKALAEFEQKRAHLNAISPEQPRGSYPVRLETFEFNSAVRNASGRMMKAVFAKYPAGDAKLLNWTRLDNKDEMDAKEHFFMTRVRGDIALCLKFASFLPVANLQPLAKEFGFGSGVSTVGGPDDVAAAFSLLRLLYSDEIGSFDETPTDRFGVLSAQMTNEFRKASSRSFDARVQAIHQATRRVVAKSLAFTPPGKIGLIVC